ncbi:MAG: type II secretion system protein [Rickettsiales bacterium]
MSKTSSGFSLVELSIVLVILGLLVGGILSGQSLIRAAELRAVSTEYSRYVTAVQTFRDKYFQLPGDMNSATTFWGTAAVGAACATTIGSGTQTCNGNGDGWLDNGYVNSNENFRYWQHLANAGLIEGAYTGQFQG